MKLKIFFVVAVLSLTLASAEIDVNPSVIKVSIETGENLSTSVNVVGEGPIEIGSSFDEVFINLSKRFLNGGESFDVFIDSLKTEPGIYFGEIYVSNKSDRKVVPVIVEIESEKPDFDASSNLPPVFADIYPGKEFKINVKVFNLRAENSDVDLEFHISSVDGKVLVSENQSLRVDDQAEIVKSFILPENSESGEHVFFVYLRKNESLGINSLLFDVSPNVELSPVDKFRESYFTIFVVIVSVMVLAFVVFNHYWGKKLVKVRNVKFAPTARRVRALKRKLVLLDDAFSKRYITKESYEESKRRIYEEINELKKRL